MQQKETVLVALSGGVDSFATALLLQEQGYIVKGVTFITWTKNTKAIVASPNKKTPEECALDAAELCRKLGIEHHILDLSTAFEETVISYFVQEYLKGTTPNPCTFCNSFFKFHYLQQAALDLNCTKIATGHYANIGYEKDRYFVSTALDINKDQSYMLWNLSQEVLQMCIFPLGNKLKEDIKRYVEAKGYQEQAHTQESFSICFVPDNNYKEFLLRKNPLLKEQLNNGKLLNPHNEVIGLHEGFPFYTVGQWKHLNHNSSQKLYVEKMNPQYNELYLTSKDKLFKWKIEVDSLNFMKYNPELVRASLEVKPSLVKLTTRIRGKDPGTLSSVTFNGETAFVEFEQAVFAPTLGQSAVFYEGNDIVCGGIISKIL